MWGLPRCKCGKPCDVPWSLVHAGWRPVCSDACQPQSQGQIKPDRLPTPYKDRS
jgi:hypothetical protein